MKAISAAVLAVVSVSRQHIYDVLLAESGRDWTVSWLVSLLPSVSVEAVRATVHLMLGDGLMEIVPHTRSSAPTGQRMHELTPHASALPFFGAELRRHRMFVGLSLHALVPQVLASAALLGKVKAAQRFPSFDLAGAPSVYRRGEKGGVEMRRVKWFVPADDQPFDPAGCALLRGRGSGTSFEARVDASHLPQPSHGAQPVNLPIAGRVHRVKGGSGPCAAVVRRPGLCFARPTSALSVGSRHPRSGRHDF